MRVLLVSGLMTVILIGWFGDQPPAPVKPRTVTDISWPQCGMKVAKAEAGIVGVNGGLALRPNPCLAAEAANYKYLSVYLNTGYPGPAVAHKLQTMPKNCQPKDKACLAYNYGYNSGKYSVKYALMNGVVAKKWWLDVETENSWDNDIRVNRAALLGMLDSLKDLVGEDNLGFYSYPGQWDLITGKWRNGYPAWAATGSAEISVSRSACRPPSFTGGPIIMSQFTPKLDQNVICGAQ